VLFIPILFGMKYLYFAWLNAPASGEGALSKFQQGYLTAGGFRMRAVIYFAIWGLLVFLFNR
jgi:ABC-type glucose/galactose transport system permease subunit